MDEIDALDVTIDLTPVAPPVRIPANGGQFRYDVLIRNNTPAPVMLDAWTGLVLPNNQEYGPLLLQQQIPLAAGQQIQRRLQQAVPDYAPAGTYRHRGQIGYYPGTAVSTDEFLFTKLQAGVAGAGETTWAITGWDDEATLAAESIVPESPFLVDLYPNPFNASLTVEVSLPQSSELKLAVFNTLGQQVLSLENESLSSGYHSFTFDGSQLASGVYFVKAFIPGKTYELRKVVLVK